LEKVERKHFRILFTNKTEACINAAEMLKSKGIHFSQTEVSPNSKEFPPEKLPLLITDEGPGWGGVEAIERYVGYTLATGEL
jgi:hypothetical protein